ncbi:Predicted amino acid racemase [Virgibacillus subterraneus]|uniref:Predicted amino acid racemase n=1 Tax=Virgibacillus subterraneus TaxID=621109 RepID=A0A1H8ZEK6_9BACI|nr:alanine/ornithine racemase family PLP-dependent enzyme [Virgibacillus subterraneus]SEP62811.1 Predicted amino acid racemase [Virgibacillus subterraneus]
MIATAAPATSRVEINIGKIAHNAEKLVQFYGSKGIEIMGVTKTVCGDPNIAKIFVNKGIHILADSKIENIKKMRDAGVNAQFVLLRSPALSELDAVVKSADISMNTELAVIRGLSTIAEKYNTVHEIILMVEMGDLREGIMPADLEGFVQEILKLSGVKIIGIGANFACFGGVKPSEKKMADLSKLAGLIELKFSLPLSYVSGGNSANYNWFTATENIGKINNLRLGESIYLGRETLDRKAIPGLFTDAFTFISEVIESKIKPSVPDGETGQDAFGNQPKFRDRGPIRRAIVAFGSQDVLVTGLTPELDIEILGSSSDHTILDAKDVNLQVGDQVKFSPNYGALLAIMSSSYITKKYTNVKDNHILT